MANGRQREILVTLGRQWQRVQAEAKSAILVGVYSLATEMIVDEVSEEMTSWEDFPDELKDGNRTEPSPEMVLETGALFISSSEIPGTLTKLGVIAIIGEETVKFTTTLTEPL